MNKNGALSPRKMSAAGEKILKLHEGLVIIQFMQETQIIIASSQNVATNMKVTGKREKQVISMKDLRMD